MCSHALGLADGCYSTQRHRHALLCALLPPGAASACCHLPAASCCRRQLPPTLVVVLYLWISHRHRKMLETAVQKTQLLAVPCRSTLHCRAAASWTVPAWTSSGALLLQGPGCAQLCTFHTSHIDTDVLMHTVPTPTPPTDCVTTCGAPLTGEPSCGGATVTGCRSSWTTRSKARCCCETAPVTGYMYSKQKH